MKSSITFISSILVLLITTTFAANTTTQDFQVQCLRFPLTVTGNTTFNPDAITGLSKALNDNSFTPKLPAGGITLSPGRSSRIGWAGSGGYQVCLQNFWFFRTVTVPLNDLSAATAQLRTSCCTDANGKGGAPGIGGRNGLCQDARAVVKATDGSEVKVVAQDYGARCCGMWAC